VGELKAYLDQTEFADDAPVGVWVCDKSGKPLGIRFPRQVSTAKGTGLPDMLVFALPKLE